MTTRLLPDDDEVHTNASWTTFRLPKSHWHCQLDNFSWTNVRPASLKTRVTEFVARSVGQAAPDDDDDVGALPHHLVLTGTPGIGKSHIGVAVYRAAVAAVGSVRATWLNVPSFCEAVKSGYGSDGSATRAAWEDYEAATQLVVLDDLFGRDLTQHEASQIVYRLIDVAYRNGAAMLVTMNQSVHELEARLASHEISRLLQNALIAPMTATEDWRRK